MQPASYPDSSSQPLLAAQEAADRRRCHCTASIGASKPGCGRQRERQTGTSSAHEQATKPATRFMPACLLYSSAKERTIRAVVIADAVGGNNDGDGSDDVC